MVGSEKGTEDPAPFCKDRW